MADIAKWKERHKEQEERRIGEIYRECERRGCSHDFLVSFDTRIWLYPMKQTLSFLDNPKEFSDKIRQWKIYLEVLIEKRPQDKMSGEWVKSLREIDNSL